MLEVILSERKKGSINRNEERKSKGVRIEMGSLDFLTITPENIVDFVY
jgi:hypothetical protein